MFLYKNGIRYLVKEDLVSVNKKQAIHEIVKAMDTLRLTDQQIDNFIPMRFVHTPKGLIAPDYVDKETYPYLNTVVTKQKAYGVQVEKLAYPGSVAIYKEVFLFLSQFRWVYTYDTSYEDIVKQQVGIPPRNEGQQRRMFLVPDCFLGLTFPTVLTEELVFDEVEVDTIIRPTTPGYFIEHNTAKMNEVIEKELELPTEIPGEWAEELPDMENVKEESNATPGNFAE